MDLYFSFRNSVCVFLMFATLYWSCFMARADVFYSNVVQNGSFEQGSGEKTVTGWSVFNNANRYVGGPTHSGNYSICTWGGYWGGWNASGLLQRHSAREGQIWEASVWMMRTSVVEVGTTGRINIEFCNAQTQVIYTGSSAIRIDTDAPTSQWVKISVKAQATRNTAFVNVAPLLLQSPEYGDGIVWFDDCSLYQVPAGTIDFAGRTWQVADWPGTPGENYFSTNCVWVDSNGWLHMALKKMYGIWHCPALETTNSLGFGEYRWYLNTPLELMDSNLVVGLFTYAQESTFGTNQNEVDIEVSHAFPGTQTNCLLYTVQPYTIGGNGYQHPLETTNDITTHRFFWRPDRIDWQSYYGHTDTPADDQFLAGWRFNRRGIPIETNERAMMNLWLFETNMPASTQNLELVIRDFVFIPFNGFILLDEFDDGTRSTLWVTAGTESDVLEGEGLLTISPSSASAPSGYQTAEYIHRNERGTKYVFSARLSDLEVPVTRSGADIIAQLSLSTATNKTPYQSGAAIILQGRYDADADILTFDLYTKSNTSNSLGTLRYEGTLGGVSDYLASGGVDWRLGLDPQNYEVEIRDATGVPLSLTTVSGSSTGLHQTGEAVNNAFWLVGAQRIAADAGGAVSWSRTVVGAPDQIDSFEVESSVTSDGSLQFSMPGYYDSKCILYRMTNLAESFIAVETNSAVDSPVEVMMDSAPGSEKAYYKIGVTP